MERIQALLVRYENAASELALTQRAYDHASVEFEEARQAYIRAAREESRRLTNEHMARLAEQENR